MPDVPADKAPTPAPAKPVEKAPAAPVPATKAPAPATPAEKPPAPQAKEIKPTTVYSGIHDRVQAVSVNSNGTAAQVHPELLGDYTASVAELTARFAQQEATVSDGALTTMQTNHAAVLTALSTEGH
jgi:hypothetical protein